MLDLHNHMLPGLDDGAPDWDQSLAMARQAVEDGIEGVVCTPHWVPGRYPNSRSVVLGIFQELQDRLKAARIPLRVYPGAELRFEPGLCRAILEGEVLTINDTGRYALIELSESALPRNLEDFLWELQVQKITPVLAHPERNPFLIRDPQRLYDWVEKGILVQVTAASMEGAFGRRVEAFATLLVAHNLAHVLATDAHGLNGRSSRLTGAYHIIEKIRGEKAAKDMVLTTPRQIIEGKAVVPQDPVPFHPRPAGPGLFRRLFRPFLGGIAAALLIAGCGGGPTIQEIEPEPGVALQWNKKNLRWELASRPVEDPTVREVTPAGDEAEGPDETLIRSTRLALSPRDYLREKFNGKEVIFPDETAPAYPGSPTYRVGAEDELYVFVWQNPDLSIESVVREDGKISLPLVGEVHAGGLSIPELENVLEQRYTQYLEKPQVSVTVKTVNSLKVYITGAVRIPESLARRLVSGFPLPPDRRLLSALSQVEILPDADLREAYVIRGESIIPLDLQRLLEDGDTVQNITLETNDTIVIPGKTKRVTVLGEAKQPGRHRVERRTRLLDALAVAGGVNDETAALEMAYVARGRKILPVNLKRLVEKGDADHNILVEDNDIIHIPSLHDNKVFVLGEVKKPGVVNFRKPIDLIEAIGEAGDFSEAAHRRQVVVVRGGLQDPKVYAVNALNMMEGVSHERFILNRYDIVYVPRSLIGDWNWLIRQLLPTATVTYMIERIYD